MLSSTRLLAHGSKGHFTTAALAVRGDDSAAKTGKALPLCLVDVGGGFHDLDGLRRPAGVGFTMALAALRGCGDGGSTSSGPTPLGQFPVDAKPATVLAPSGWCGGELELKGGRHRARNTRHLVLPPWYVTSLRRVTPARKPSIDEVQRLPPAPDLQGTPRPWRCPQFPDLKPKAKK
mmetsp:Transcript_43135/g.119316  ORF Transcript_43135/g.119316 Transcript_43135/m.119316 type:complete len:177 (+) Transcript_43135:84-614(+)